MLPRPRQPITIPEQEGRAGTLKIGYMRVSRGDRQDLSMQERALNGAGCERLFSDTASGARWNRAGMEAMLAHLRTGDEVVVWKLDRVARSLRDLLTFIDTLGRLGVGLRSSTENLDTTGSVGRLAAQLLGVFAEFERSLVIERTRAGLDAARAKGTRLGRPPQLSREQRSKIVADVEAGTMTQPEAARLFNVSRSTIIPLS